MRLAAEREQWGRLRKKRSGRQPAPIASTLVSGYTFDASRPCTIVGGRNGSGKSRVLRDLASVLGSDAVLLDLHYLCEQALMLLRSRDDFDDMINEYSSIGPDADRRADVERIIGREYGSIEWFAFDVEPHDPNTATRFSWSGSQPLVPFFQVSYRGTPYTGRDMGLGEFSVHFLFWILEQYRESTSLTILLDEVDAYLPPVGVSKLYARLLRICDERDWQVIASSHSEELIAQAVEQDSFVLLGVDDHGNIEATSSVVDSRIADPLLARPRLETVWFCEDESAYHALYALLWAAVPATAKRSAVSWVGGDGSLRRLREHLPRPPRPEVSFAVVFDGDQRTTVETSVDGQWPALFLPMPDPDSAFQTLKADPQRLAERLAVPSDECRRTLENLEGGDPHDWVNGLCEEFGRQHVLSRLAALWCEVNPDQVNAFAAEAFGTT